MPSPNFLNLPSFQRKIRQQESMREAAGYAVPNINDIVSEESAAQAQKQEYGKSRASQLDIQNRRIGLEQQRLDTTKDLNLKREAFNRSLADKHFEIDNKMLEFQKEQDNWATGLGIANTGLELMGAVSRVRMAEKESASIKKMTDMYLEMIDLQKRRFGNGQSI